MSGIKLRESVKNIKTLDKANDLSKHIKNAVVRTKEKVEENQQIDQEAPNTYAAESVAAKAKEISSFTMNKTEQFGRQSFQKAPETLQKAKTGAFNVKQKIYNTAANIKTKNTVKTAGRTTANTVKTTKQTAHASAKVTQTTFKTSQKAAQAAKVAAKASAQTAKVTVKAIAATVKAAAASIKGLVTLIAAGGWIAVAIILVVCTVALIIGSGFGIFFSNDKAGSQNNLTMTMVIVQINNEFSSKIEQIEHKNPHDEVDGITSPQNWKEVLAVYAVRYSEDSDNPMEIATIDDSKVEAIKTVFWDMNSISFTLETVNSDDTSSQTEQTYSNTILHIAVKSKSYSEMAAQYAFSPEQLEQLNELMSDQYKDVWEALLKEKS